ncbi:hypothetical protein [Mesorhizobium sp. BHbdii]
MNEYQAGFKHCDLALWNDSRPSRQFRRATGRFRVGAAVNLGAAQGLAGEGKRGRRKSVPAGGPFLARLQSTPNRTRDVLEILVLSHKGVFDSNDGGYVQAAVRIEDGARPEPEPAETREVILISLRKCRKVELLGRSVALMLGCKHR